MSVDIILVSFVAVGGFTFSVCASAVLMFIIFDKVIP
jgi:hypothetical protein